MSSYVSNLNENLYETTISELNYGLGDSNPSKDKLENKSEVSSETADKESSKKIKKLKNETSIVDNVEEAASKDNFKQPKPISKEAASDKIANVVDDGVFNSLSKVLGDKVADKLGGFAGDLTSMGLDRGAAFLTGAATTALAASPVGTAMGAVGIAGEQAMAVTALMDACKDKLIDDITGIATTYITKLTTLPATATLELTAKASYYLAEYSMMPADILKDLVDIGKFATNSDMVQANVKGAAMDKMNAGIDKALGGINSKVSEKCEKVNSFITMLTSYSTEGVDWIMAQMESYTGMITNEVGAYVGKGYEIAEYNVMLGVDKVGEIVGKGAAEVINAGIKLTLKKGLDKAEAKKVFGQKLAEAKVKQAIQKIKGLMGG